MVRCVYKLIGVIDEMNSSKPAEQTAEQDEMNMLTRDAEAYGSQLEMDRNEIVDLVVNEFRTMSPGELSEQEFNIAVETVINNGSFSWEQWEDTEIDYEEILERVGEIEDEGMDFPGGMSEEQWQSRSVTVEEED